MRLEKIKVVILMLFLPCSYSITLVDTRAEIKMSSIRKRKSDLDKKVGKTWRSPTKTTILGLMCEKMAERALAVQQQVEEIAAANSLAQMVAMEEDEGAVDEDENADEGIWQLTDRIEIIEDEMGGEEVDVLAALLELAEWEEVETETSV